jgi:hypothetical protein
VVTGLLLLRLLDDHVSATKVASFRIRWENDHEWLVGKDLEGDVLGVSEGIARNLSEETGKIVKSCKVVPCA